MAKSVKKSRKSTRGGGLRKKTKSLRSKSRRQRGGSQTGGINNLVKLFAIMYGNVLPNRDIDNVMWRLLPLQIYSDLKFLEYKILTEDFNQRNFVNTSILTLQSRNNLVEIAKRRYKNSDVKRLLRKIKKREKAEKALAKELQPLEEELRSLATPNTQELGTKQRRELEQSVVKIKKEIEGLINREVKNTRLTPNEEASLFIEYLQPSSEIEELVESLLSEGVNFDEKVNNYLREIGLGGLPQGDTPSGQSTSVVRSAVGAIASAAPF